MKTYRWKANADILFQSGLRGYRFNNNYFTLNPDGDGIVKAGYACDGITPHIRLGRLGYLGLPEGVIQEDTMLPSTSRAFFIHDALIQFKDEIGITRSQTHPEFCREIMVTQFPLRLPYCWGVNLYGLVKR